MTSILTTALAAPFDWTTGATDLVLTFASGTSPINVALPSGTYRVMLGSSSTDVLQATKAAINTAASGAGRSEVFDVAMGADGRVTISSTGAFAVSGLSTLSKLLGFTSAPTTTTSATAQRAPKYLATFVERQASAIVPRTAARFAVTGGGESYGWRSGVVVGHCDALQLGFIPADPTYAAGLGASQTPAMPDDAYLATLGSHDGVWSVADVLMVSGGKVIAYAPGNLQTLRSSTSARYYLGALGPDDVARPRFELDDPAWPAWQRLTLTFTRSASTPSATRA